MDLRSQKVLIVRLSDGCVGVHKSRSTMHTPSNKSHIHEGDSPTLISCNHH